MVREIWELLDDDLLTSYKEQQEKEKFQRNVNGDYEPISYQPGSSLRFWVNDIAQEYPLHWHPAIEFIVPLKRNYTATVGRQTFVLEPGDILIIPGGELHHLVPPPPPEKTGQRLIFLIDLADLSQIRGFPFLTALLDQPILLNRKTCPEIYDAQVQIIIRMLKEYFGDDNLKELSIFSQLIAFFVNYARFSALSGYPYKHSEAGIKKNEIHRFNNIFDYIKNHCLEDITLEMVSETAGFSKFHFSRLFKQYSGLNFHDYLLGCRIRAAEKFLADPALSITEAAFQSGFSSLSTFNRAFKKQKGCTPSEYRELFNRQAHEQP